VSATLTIGGVLTDTASQAGVIAAQLVAEAAQGITTHEGVVTGAFTLVFRSATLSFAPSQQIIADQALYAALNAAPGAASSITWSN
jgi:hypothetical protein